MGTKKILSPQRQGRMGKENAMTRRTTRNQDGGSVEVSQGVSRRLTGVRHQKSTGKTGQQQQQQQQVLQQKGQHQRQRRLSYKRRSEERDDMASNSKQSKPNPEEVHSEDGEKPMRLREWLRQHLERNDVPGLEWLDRDDPRPTFTIRWMHMSNQNYEKESHGNIYTLYAKHKGLPVDNLSTIKATFRNALNKLRDVEQITQPGAKKGSDAKRTFRFLLPNETKRRGKQAVKKKSKTSIKKVKRRSSNVTGCSHSSYDSSSSSSPHPSIPSTSSESVAASPSQHQTVTEEDPYDDFLPIGTFTPPISSPSNPILATENPLIAEIPPEIDVPEPAKDPSIFGSWTAKTLLPLSEVDPQRDNNSISFPPQHTKQEEDFKPDTVQLKQNSNTFTTYQASSLTSPSPADLKNFLHEVKREKGWKQLEPQLQSGSSCLRLPNFAELGVSDTYLPQEIHTNTKLCSGGNVKVKDIKTEASVPHIVIQNDVVGMMSSEGIMRVLSKTKVLNTCEQTAIDEPLIEQTYQPHSDLNLGQTLEISNTITSESSQAGRLQTPVYEAVADAVSTILDDSGACSEGWPNMEAYDPQTEAPYICTPSDASLPEMVSNPMESTMEVLLSDADLINANPLPNPPVVIQPMPDSDLSQLDDYLLQSEAEANEDIFSLERM